MSRSVMMVLDVVIMIIGGYMLTAAVQMKRSGTISPTLLAKEDLGRCTDKKGFIDYMYRKEEIFGIVTLLVGAVELIGELLVLHRAVKIAAMLVFLGAFLWFQSETKKARAQFLRN